VGSKSFYVYVSGAGIFVIHNVLETGLHSYGISSERRKLPIVINSGFNLGNPDMPTVLRSGCQ